MDSSNKRFEADFAKALNGTICDICGEQVIWESTYEGYAGDCACLNMSWFMEPLEVVVTRENID